MNLIDRDEEFLTKEELAKLLRTSERTIQNMRARGQIPVTKISKGLVRYPRVATLRALGLLTVPPVEGVKK